MTSAASGNFALGTARPVAVVTAGGTREAIDDVRHLANVATGALPCAMAEALMARGWQVEYLHGPGARRPGHLPVEIDATSADWPARWHEAEVRAERMARKLRSGQLHLHPIQTATEAAETLAALCRASQPALTVCAMAVADFAPKAVAGKLQSRADSLGQPTAPYGQPQTHDLTPAHDVLRLDLYPTPKAIDGVRAAAPHTRLVAFKLLAGADEATLLQASVHLAHRAQADLVFANDMKDYRAGSRTGLLLAAHGAVLARLDGGHGEEATQRLAELIVQYVARDLAALPVNPDAPTRRIDIVKP
ncbi:MAG: hypothetical protein HY902_11090 [Deltaproteobacteria bacterium]|nr:hypothetical protein [Deltaproteobacteria bacterium]